MLSALVIMSCLLGTTSMEPSYKVLEPIEYKNLAVFPVVIQESDQDLKDRYLTLDEGIKLKLVEVKEMGDDTPPLRRQRPTGIRNMRNDQPQFDTPIQEVRQSSGPEVNRLRLINRSKKVLVLIAGELVVGGKQDRIVQKDTLIKPGPEGVPLAVFCVENGRWDNQNVKFGNVAGGFAGNVADPSIRGVAQAKADQSEVWTSVAGKNKSLGTENQTGTYQAAIASKKVQGNIAGYLKAIESKFPKNAAGAIVAVNGKLVWIDLFPAVPSLFGQYWPKLIRSYALDAISTPHIMTDPVKMVTVGEATAFLEDRTGKATFEGQEKLYKLTRTESKSFVIYDILDLGVKPNPRLHTCKMLKR